MVNQAPNKAFSIRCVWVMERGDLTISDLATLLDRPRPTVNTWVNGRTPHGPSGRFAIRRLDLLQDMVRKRHGFPVPEMLAGKQRVEYIQGIRDVVDKHVRVSPMRATG